MRCTKKKERKHKINKISKSNQKRHMIANYVDNGVSNYSWIAEQLNLERQNVRNIVIKYLETGIFEEEKRGKKRKLISGHSIFIKSFYENKSNIGKTLLDLKTELIDTFNLEEDFISIASLYRELTRNNFVYKQVAQVKKETNAFAVKEKRNITAKHLLDCYLKEHHMIYIDESGFNINLQPKYHFSKKGQIFYAEAERKSNNYSYVAAIDHLGLIG